MGLPQLPSGKPGVRHPVLPLVQGLASVIFPTISYAKLEAPMIEVWRCEPHDVPFETCMRLSSRRSFQRFLLLALMIGLGDRAIIWRFTPNKRDASMPLHAPRPLLATGRGIKAPRA
jgi:hypothetical protein